MIHEHSTVLRVGLWHISHGYRIVLPVATFLANVNCRRPSVRLSVCLSSVTFVHPTHAIEIFGNVSTPFGTLAM